MSFNSWQRTASTPNRFKFQGQEHIDDLGLNWDSFKWRNHQPDIGRFFNVDPLAEDYYYNSPYAFSENDVISSVELEGLEKARITNWKIQKGVMQKIGTYTLNEAGDWEGTRYINQYVVYDDDGNWQKAYSSMDVGGSELMMAKDGVKVDKVIAEDVDYGELMSKGFSDYRGGMAKETAGNVAIAGLSIFPGSTITGVASKSEKVLAGVDIALKIDDISEIVSDDRISILENLIGKDAASSIKLLINTINAGAGVVNTATNPSAGNIIETADNAVSAYNEFRNDNDKKE